MAYKRQIDRLPIVPKDAKEFNVTCCSLMCLLPLRFEASRGFAATGSGVGTNQQVAKFGMAVAAVGYKKSNERTHAAHICPVHYRAAVTRTLEQAGTDENR